MEIPFGVCNEPITCPFQATISHMMIHLSSVF